MENNPIKIGELTPEKNQQSKKNIPVGMILILIFIGWSLMSMVSAFKNPFIQAGPFILEGFAAIVFNVIVTLIILAIILGILKKYKWAWKLTIGWYSFSVILNISNLILFKKNPAIYDSYMEYYKRVLPPASLAVMTSKIITGTLISALIFGCIFATLIIIYFAKKKDYFVN